MPDSFMIHKAGKLSFLLVCLFLCTACRGKQAAVFEAGAENALPAVIREETDDVTDAAEEQITEAAKDASPNIMININTANLEELMLLPGIGKVRAAAIIEHRENYGEFKKIEDIMNVKGIKTGIFSKINSLICVK